MPPRATRARGGGRGRGRGGSTRGGSAAASASGDTSTAAVPEETAQTSQRAVDGNTPTEPIPAPDLPAQTVPPELSTPQPSNSQTKSSVKPTGLAGSKYKPKAIRRNEAARARAEEEYNRQLAESNALEAQLQPRTTRGRGRGRARGNLMRGSGRGTFGAPLSGGMSFGSLNAGSAQYTEPNESGTGGMSGDGGNRINADALYGYVQEEEVKSTSMFVPTNLKKRPMMPMGIRRVEHKEEPVVMITTAEIEALKRDDNGEPAAGTTDDGVRAHAVPKNGSQVQIKEEPVDEDRMDLDPAEGQIKVPDSPELSKKDVKAKKPVFKDMEEELAADRLQRMLELFTVQEDGQASKLEGHMFLFQFPLTLAPLEATPAPGGTFVKQDSDDDEELFVSNDPPATTASIDLTTVDDSKVKNEGGDDSEDEDDDNGEPPRILPEAGFVGNLTVRKSGKTELSWGGARMEVDEGIATHFFSQAVLIEEGDVKPGQVDSTGGTALGMGRIQGKFTTAYVWEEEEEWNPTEEELEY